MKPNNFQSLLIRRAREHIATRRAAMCNAYICGAIESAYEVLALAARADGKPFLYAYRCEVSPLLAAVKKALEGRETLGLYLESFAGAYPLTRCDAMARYAGINRARVAWLDAVLDGGVLEMTEETRAACIRAALRDIR